MIHLTKGDIFKSTGEYLVIPVNCVGVMGNGLAGYFKMKCPECFSTYLKACKDKTLINIGYTMFKMPSGKTAVLLATKYHWRENSQPELIERALRNLSDWCTFNQVDRVDFPMIGCGKGNLDWERDVFPLIEKYFKDIETVAHCYI